MRGQEYRAVQVSKPGCIMGDKRIARSINQRWDIWRIMTGHQWKTAWRSR